MTSDVMRVDPVEERAPSASSRQAFRPAPKASSKGWVGRLKSQTSAAQPGIYKRRNAGLKARSSTGESGVDSGLEARSGAGDVVVKVVIACCGFLFLVCFLGLYGFSSELNIPATIQAGAGLSIPTSGSGDATLYVVGPGAAIKRQVRLGGNVHLSGDELQNAGRYVVSLDGNSATFFVTAAPVHSIAFLARPSRVPADTPNVVTGTAFLFDRYQNLVLQPQPVKFELNVNGQTVTRTETSKGGIAYTKLDSSKKEGPAQFTASCGGATVRRVVQEVASDPCSIRMTAQRDQTGILVRTDPIRDCAGNPVPDGTIVTFTSTDAQGKSTVDARIKRGVAEAQLPASKNATISVASGVVVGNEINWRGE